MNERTRIFAPDASRAFGERVAAHLGATLAPLEERVFEDGEHKVRPLASVRGAEVFVVDALHRGGGLSVDDKLVRLLLLCGTLRDHGAARTTLVAPYLCYGRKDRRTKLRDPISTRYVAQLVEAMGVDRVVALEVHNLQAYENAFRIPALHLEAWPVLAEAATHVLAGRPAAVVSPDLGGVARATRFASELGRRLGQELPIGFAEKHRSGGMVTGEALVGDVEGRVALLVDDLVSTGTTLARAAGACLRHGAVACAAVAAHGLFGEAAVARLEEAPLERVIVTDSVEPTRLPARVEVVGVAALVARAIDRLSEDRSLTDPDG